MACERRLGSRAVRKFKAERAQPFWDLVGLVATDRPLARAVDLGCGTGELTADAAERSAVAEMVGVDNSPACSPPPSRSPAPACGSSTATSPRGWRQRPAPTVDDPGARQRRLQWVPDHRAVLARWAAALRPGGQLAVQVPANADHASHLASAEVAATEPFLSAMDGPPPPDPVAVNVLRPSSTRAVVRARVRAAARAAAGLPARDGSTRRRRRVDQGHSLTRFFKRLPAELHEPFVDAYRSRAAARIGDTLAVLLSPSSGS